MRFLLLIIALFAAAPGYAWNAAGHRLAAVIAWQTMAPATQTFVAEGLAHHPDYPHWREKAGSQDFALVFAEAATWPDSIRSDPRYYDERRQRPSPPITGLPDHARHTDWHFSNPPSNGRRAQGQLDRQIERLDELLRSTGDPAEIAWALPWLAHLISDLHQPLHVSPRDDRGGNTVEIEDPFNPRQPFVNLHSWWDQLPGSSSLRGKRLLRAVAQLRHEYTPPEVTPMDNWLTESRALVDACYPTIAGSVLPIIDAPFRQQAQTTAQRRVAESGYRLGQLLDAISAARVSRETAP